MKLNKSLLITTLVTSGMLLVACNEKNKTEATQAETKAETTQPVAQETAKANAEQTQPTTQEKTEASTEQAQPTTQEKTEASTEQTQPTTQEKTEASTEQAQPTTHTETDASVIEQKALDQFNKAVAIVLTGYRIDKDTQNQDTLSFIYQVTNKSNKAIKEVQWFNLFLVDSKIVDVLDIPVVFEKTLAAEKTEEVTLTKLANTYPENIKDSILNKKADFKFTPTIAGKIVFEDGTELIVTKFEDITNSLQKHPNQ
ncbi:putative lipoprotein [Canicola haemoglobinophilus]|uniref:Lipoprotein n=1 Tax=Canicola haemoglobinophilus TaxID=733 RepID=A0AB38H727_9PAST|nr:hypothetical protein [Canicola haemoglobinophilus]STO53508.1 putative lipoprotein [Canicola haemoglobinophilus]STO68042.1 putative lipoprotein [Canicola haemoglobinophilus]